MPFIQGSANYDLLSMEIKSAASIFVNIFESCPRSDDALNVFCHYLFPKCGTETAPELPVSVCSDACRYTMTETCPEEWATFLRLYEDLLNPEDITFIDCSDTGAHLEPLPYCCSNFGIDIRKKILKCGVKW